MRPFFQMSGGALEEEEKARNSDSPATPNLDSLLSTVDEVSMLASVPKDAKDALAEIADIRKEGWPEQKPSAAEAQKAVSTRSKIVIEQAPPNPKSAPAAAMSGAAPVPRQVPLQSL
jgi:hypothetical protein